MRRGSGPARGFNTALGELVAVAVICAPPPHAVAALPQLMAQAWSQLADRHPAELEVAELPKHQSVELAAVSAMVPGLSSSFISARCSLV
jgi:hypothetical protein